MCCVLRNYKLPYAADGQNAFAVIGMVPNYMVQVLLTSAWVCLCVIIQFSHEFY